MKGYLELRARPFDGTAVNPGAVINLLSDGQQKKLRSITTVLECKRGTTIFSQCGEAHFLYVVEKGIVRLSR